MDLLECRCSEVCTTSNIPTTEKNSSQMVGGYRIISYENLGHGDCFFYVGSNVK